MITELIAGLGGIVVFGLILRFQQSRINKMDERKMDRRGCDSIMKAFKEDLERGSKKFETIEQELKDHGAELSTQTTTLALIQQRVDFLATKNGFAKNDG